MKRRGLFISFAIIVLAGAFWSGAFESNIEKIAESSGLKFLKTEKVHLAPALQGSFRKKSLWAKIQDATEHRLEVWGVPEMVRQYQEEPVLFGILFIFAGVSACGIAFIIHLIRSDARF